MKREEIRNFLRLGADAVEIFFGYGEVPNFNSKMDKAFPLGWLEPLQVSTAFGTNSSTLIDTWTVRLHIAKKDFMDSEPSDYEDLIDVCDHYARRLIWQYNLILGGDDSIETDQDLKDLYRLVTMEGISRTPFIKKHSDCLTGVILEFTLVTPDKTDVC